MSTTPKTMEELIPKDVDIILDNQGRTLCSRQAIVNAIKQSQLALLEDIEKTLPVNDNTNPPAIFGFVQCLEEVKFLLSAKKKEYE